MKIPPDGVYTTRIIIHFIRSFALLCWFTFLVTPTSAQILQNGQIFTNGLAIIDAPAPNAQLSAGGPLGLAVDVSGNGRIPAVGQVPGSGLATSFGSLEVYLTSYLTGINFTVSAGPGLLQREVGSTVKHINPLLPACIPTGPYNLTFYESSTLEGNPFFSITYLPVFINNAVPTGICLPQINTLLPFPQLSNPMSYNPFLAPATPTTTIAFANYPTQAPTMTVTSTVRGMTTVYTQPRQSFSGEIFITLTSGESILPEPTKAPSESAITVTVVYVSVSTVTTVENGQSTTYTTDYESTTTQVLQPTGFGGLLPVNASPRQSIPWLASLVCALVMGHLM